MLPKEQSKDIATAAISDLEKRWDSKFEEINTGFAEIKTGFAESRQENDERFAVISRQFQEVLAALQLATTGGSEIVAANEGDSGVVKGPADRKGAQDCGPANSPDTTNRVKTDDLEADAGKDGDDLQDRCNIPAAVWKLTWVILVLALIVYVGLVFFTYYCFSGQFSGAKTNRWVDGLYFWVVTLSTVGYGDIVPSSSTTKIFTIVWLSIGIVITEFSLNRLANHLLSHGRIRLKWRLCAALCVVIFCVTIGTCFLHLFEQLDWLDSVYLAVVSVSIGYGDKAFKTVEGRIFAVLWILLSNISMACLFAYISEMKIGRAEVMKLPTCKPEFIMSKLKESGKITEDDINQITVAL